MVKSFTEAFLKVLNKSAPDQPILSKYKTPETRLKEEAEEKKRAKQKLAEKAKKKLKAYNSQTDMVAEKQLKQAALKGIVKLFNEISTKQLTYKSDKKLKNARKNCKV